MKRNPHLLARPAFHIFLAGLGLVLFHWPVLYWPEGSRQPHSFIYLFTVWTILVAALWRISRGLGPHLPKTREPRDEDQGKDLEQDKDWQ